MRKTCSRDFSMTEVILYLCIILYLFIYVITHVRNLTRSISDMRKGDVTPDDSQRRFIAQHSFTILEQCCNHLKRCRNNVATLCGAKNRRRESSRVTLP